MLKRKILLNECLFPIYFLLQIFYPANFFPLTSLIGFIILSITKYVFEGFRIAYPLTLLAQITFMTSTSFYLQLTFTTLTILALWLFPVYKSPQTTGKYHVGYRVFPMPDNNTINVSIYYPTLQKTYGDIKCLPDHDSFEKFATMFKFYAKQDRFRKPISLPKTFFKLGSNFLKYQSINVHVNADTVLNQRFPVIIFSPDLSLHPHLYSILLKEWASHGFVVFAINHTEQLSDLNLEAKEVGDYLESRRLLIENRKEILKKLLNLISDENEVRYIFQTWHIQLDYSKIFLAGHSFGGVTVAEIATDSALAAKIAGVLLLNPWFEGGQSSIVNEIGPPVLVLDCTLWNTNPKIRRFVKKPEKLTCFYGMFKGSVQNEAMDFMVLMPREMWLLGIFHGINKIEEKVRNRNVLTRVFFESLVKLNGDLRADENKERLKDFVLMQYRKTLEQLNTTDTFVW